jgi:hypothetical protein
MSHSTLILFICVAPHKKSKGLPIDVTFYSYTFYMCSAAYKKQGASDRCPILLLYFLHVQHRVQKVRGSRLMSRSTLILFTCVVPLIKIKGLLNRTSLYFSYTFIINVWKAQDTYIYKSNICQVFSKIISLFFINWEYFIVECRNNITPGSKAGRQDYPYHPDHWLQWSCTGIWNIAQYHTRYL